MRYAILGPVELREGSRTVVLGGRRQVALLALLLVRANRAVASDELIDALWGDLGPEGAVKRLQVAVTRLRRTLDVAGRESSVLRTVRGGYLLEVQPGEVDAEVFAARLAEGRQALDGGDVRRARLVLGDALGMWRGPALADVAYEEFALTEIRRLEELRLCAIEARVDAQLDLSEHGGLISELDALVTAHPGRERFAHQLMLALYRSGRQGEALDVYGRARAYLSGELGLEPGQALKSLQREILAQAPSLELRSSASEPVASGLDMSPSGRLPPALAGITGDLFVGRHRDLEHLADVYAQAAGGSRRFVTLSGEPGIGKTRLAAEFALRAHEQGAIVLYGRCDEEALLAQQPFAEALRHYVDAYLSQSVADRLRLSGELRWVVPEIADRIAELPEPLAGDPDGARTRMFEAVCSLLFQAAQDAPLVLVLDDLHWGDRSTLLLLKHLVRQPRPARLMVLGTYRETDLDVDHPLAGLLLDLGRARVLERLSLARMDASAVAELVADHAGDNASPELREVVYEGTDGNAFFVLEVLRHLAELGAIGSDATEPQAAIAAARLALPEGVKELIGQRVARLGSDTQRLLSTASVLGRAFELDVLKGLTEVSEDDLIDRLEAAARAHLIEEVTGCVGRYTFSHALIRNTLYRGLSATRRARLHIRAGIALEQARAPTLERQLAELAHHFGHGAPHDHLEKALDYGARAGRQAVTLLAYEQAAGHFRQTAELIDAAAPRALQLRRCDLAIAQGNAERHAGDSAFRETLLNAARLAQELDDPERLARAALANNRGFASSAEGVDRDRVAVLRAALESYDRADSPTRAALLSLLALELVADEDWVTRGALSDDALAMARRIGEPRTLALVLVQRCMVQWRAEVVSELRDDLHEASELAERLQDPLLAGHVAKECADAAMELGDLAEADRRLRQLTAIADQLRQPFMRWWEVVARAKRCLISGPAEEAERCAFEALELAQSAGQPDAMSWFLSQLFVVRFLQGSLNADDPHLPDLFNVPGSSLPIGPELTPGRSTPLLISAAMSVVLSEVGRLDDARRHLDLLMSSDLDELRHDYAALAIPSYASVACAHLEDVACARRLHALLEPYDVRLVNTGSGWFGTVNHHLAVLAATLGRSDEADARFCAAEQTYVSLNATPWLRRLRMDRRGIRLADRRQQSGPSRAPGQR